MADNEIPPVPVPPAGAGVPPVEPAPTPPTAPAPPANPYAAAPPASPYAAPTAGPAPVSAPGYAPPAYAPQGALPPQGLSITSMILGIGGILLSFVGFGFLPSLAAVITGHLAQKRQPHAKAFWLTGIITGYVGLGIAIITGIVVIAIFAIAASYSN